VKQNRNALTYEMQAELELCAVPEAIERKLRQVYAGLPEKVPARKRILPRWAQRSLATAASLATAFTVLLGVNGANPALAEGLPFVGGIFQNINRKFVPTQNLTEAQRRVSDMAVPVGENQETSVTVPAGGMLEKPLTASLKEVYYDGSFVFAGIEFQIDADDDYVSERMGPHYDVLLNGESQIEHGEDGMVTYQNDNGSGFVDMSLSDMMTQVERGRYITQRAFRVPDALQGAESLNVSLSFEGLDSEKAALNSTPFTLDFTAQKTEANIRSIHCQGAEMGGVRLLSAYTTPAATYIEVEYPGRYVNPATGAAFEDGIAIGYYGANGGAVRLCATEADLGNGMLQKRLVLAGLKEDESRKVVCWLLDKNGSGRYEAVFILDFAAGTVELGSAEDVQAAPVFDYACGAEAVKALAGGEYAIEKIHLDQNKPMVYLMTGDKKRDLRVEFWQEGARACTAYSDGYSWRDDALYWEYYNLKNGSSMSRDEDRYEGTEHRQHMLFVPELYVSLDPGLPVTVKVFDKDSGDGLLAQEVALTQSQLHSEPQPLAEAPLDQDGLDAVSSESTE
jgi:hypothetical protein